MGTYCFYASTFTHRIPKHTDQHNVDEDMTTVLDLGGNWRDGSWTGIFDRFMNSTGGATSAVASSNVHLYTDGHDVDEDSKTVVQCGGRWSNGGGVGVMLRLLMNAHIDTFSYVASKQKIIYLLPHRKEAYSYIFNI